MTDAANTQSVILGIRISSFAIRRGKKHRLIAQHTRIFVMKEKRQVRSNAKEPLIV
jgi:hypothetical protein